MNKYKLLILICFFLIIITLPKVTASVNNINLLGNSNDYQIDVDKGIGEFTIDNVSVHDEDIYGSGINGLDVDGGLGKVTIKFINNR